MDDLYKEYREKYLNAPNLKLESPVDISLELSSFCNHHCTYCLDPETPVLMSDLNWKPIKNISEGDKIVAFDEYPNDGIPRKMRLATVEKQWETKKNSVKITTTKGGFTCSDDHKFLDISSRWTEARNLSVGQKIKFAKESWACCFDNDDYKIGYLKGMTDGDATARWHPLPGNTGKENDSRKQVWWRIALRDSEPLNKVVSYLDQLGIENNGIKVFDPGSAGYKANGPMNKIEIRAKESLKQLENLIFNDQINSDEYARGYLAGIFDSEGSHSCGILRISQKKNNDVINNILSSADKLGFNFVDEDNGVRLLGGSWEQIRFHGMLGTSIPRHREQWTDKAIQHSDAVIISIEKLGKIDLIDIQTTAKTFYAAGFPTHNCYHADKKNLPFKQNHMSPKLFKMIVHQADELGVNSLKFNWRGESTMNPFFYLMTKFAKGRANGSTFIDRITNSNFKFNHNNDNRIMEALCNQTKVKVSYDSFNKEVFEKQRAGGNHDLTTSNIDRFYNWPNRDNILVVQAVRTSLNKDEDIEGLAKKRWPSALISIRDMVEGRVEKDLEDIKHKERDYSERQSCIQAHARLIFDWNGDAVPCCPDIKMKLKIGNIRDMSVEEIFNSKKVKTLRTRLLSGSAFTRNPCKDCSSFESFSGYKPSMDS